MSDISLIINVYQYLKTMDYHDIIISYLKAMDGRLRCKFGSI